MNVKKNIINYFLILIGSYLIAVFVISSVISWREQQGKQNINRQNIVEYAKRFLEEDHLIKLGTGLDCSGYTSIVFKHFNFRLPRSSKQQFNEYLTINNELQPADLVFFAESNQSVSHVGILISDSTFIHSPGKKKPVRIDKLDDPYWKDRLIGIKTVVVGND